MSLSAHARPAHPWSFCGPRRHGAREAKEEASARAKRHAQAAMGHVLYEFGRAVEKARVVTRRAGQNQTSLNDKALFNYCNAIDTGDCPKEFRLAWFDWLTAYQAQLQHSKNALTDDFAGLAIGLLPGMQPVGLKLMANSVHESSELGHSDTWIKFRAVIRCCIEADLSKSDIQ